MGLLKKVVNILANISYLFILIYIVICIPLIFGYKPLVVLSGSMEPNYKVGSVLYYHKVAEDELSKGDVITFKYANKVVITHRIYEIEDGIIQTKGDANDAPDVQSISMENIEGKVTKINIPYVGYYINFVNTHLYCLILVAVILILEFILQNIKKERLDLK